MSRYKEKKESRENVKKAYDYLVQEKGIKPHLAAGIIGNLQQESYKHLDSSVENNIGAIGIAQWLGARRKDLERFAENRGEDFKDFDLQLDFLYHELTNTGNSWGAKAKEEFFNAKNAEEAAALFVKNFERSGEKPGEKGFDNRVNNAKSIYLQFNDKNIYSKDAKGGVVVLNPEVITEEDKKKSPEIKREFYNKQFDIPNPRPKAAEPAPIVEAKEEIEDTKKEVEFKNKIGDILGKLNKVEDSEPQPRQFNFETTDIRVQDNEFYDRFSDGGKVDDPRNKTVAVDNTLVRNKAGNEIILPASKTNVQNIDKFLNEEPKREKDQLDKWLEKADLSNVETRGGFNLPVVETRGINLERAANKRSFRVGDRGSDVKNIQSFLINNGLMDATSARGKSNLDGIYGGITKRAIEKFQKDNGLEVDGILGKKTLEAIKNKRDTKKSENALVNPKVASSTSTNKPIIKPSEKPKNKKEEVNLGEVNLEALDLEERDLSLGRRVLNKVPLMARAFIEDSFGGESPITEDYLNDGEIKALKDAVKHSIQNKSNRITYDTWRAVGAGGKDTRTDDVNLFNPAVSMQKTLGQANIIQEDNGDLYVVDTYNFNDAGDKKNRNKNEFTDENGLLPLSKATSFSNGIYRLARNYKTEHGRAEGGSKSRIFVGNIKDFN